MILGGAHDPKRVDSNHSVCQTPVGDGMAAIDKGKIRRDFAEAVNMTASELRDWLKTEESRKVGCKGKDGKASESVGHASGRRIVEIVGKEADELHGRRLCAHAQGCRLCASPLGPAAGEYLHVPVALFADELGT